MIESDCKHKVASKANIKMVMTRQDTNMHDVCTGKRTPLSAYDGYRACYTYCYCTGITPRVVHVGVYATYPCLCGSIRCV